MLVGRCSRSFCQVYAHRNGYISQGTFCYLPVRPIWYRLALSWVPRYVILVVILAIYISIYIYTKSKFGDFDTDFSSSSLTSADRSQSNASENGLRPQAPATDKGLQPTAPRSQASPSEDTPKKKGRVPKRPPLTRRPSWLKYSFSRSAPVAVVTFDGLSPQSASESNNIDSTTVSPKQQSARDPFADTVFRNPTLIEALRNRSLSALAINRKAKDPHSTLRKRHRAIQRQLRYMFVYPMVYLVMWFPPFVNYCYFYTKAHNPPFALNCFSLCFWSLQCAVDCLVFSIREKPWRHAVRLRGRFRGSEVVPANSNMEMTNLTNEMEGSALAQGQVARNRDSQALQPSPAALANVVATTRKILVRRGGPLSSILFQLNTRHFRYRIFRAHDWQ